MIWVLLQSESPWQRNDAIMLFVYLCVSLYQEFFLKNCLTTPLYGRSIGGPNSVHKLPRVSILFCILRKIYELFMKSLI